MANKNINILMKLTDKFTGPMLKATNATKAQTKAVKASQQKMVTFVNTANNKFLSMTKSIGKAALAVTGLTGAFSIVGLKNFAGKAMELANAQVAAETKLEAALKNVESISAGGIENVKRAKKELLDVASQIQQIGVIGDEVTIAGMQQLATYGLTEKQIAKLAPGLADMLAQQKGLNASQEDAVNYAKALGRAMNGSTAGLSRYGVILSDAEKKAFEMANQEERAVMLAEMLEKRVGGVNAELAKTPAGQIQQTQNAWGDMMEEIGKKILPIKAQLYSFVGEYIPSIQKTAIKALDYIQPKIDQFMQYIRDHTDDIKQGIESAKDVLQKVWKVVKPLLNFAVKHASTIIKVIAGIGAAFTALNIAMKLYQVISMISSIVSFLGPIPLLIAAIIVVLILVVKNWDKIKAKVKEVAQKIKAFLQPLIDWIKKSWDSVKTKVFAVWDAIRSKIETVVGKIKSIITGMKDAVSSAFQAIKNTVGGIFDAPLQAAKSLYDWIVKLIEKLKDFKKNYQDANGGMSPSGLITTNDNNATGTPYWKGGATRINEGGRGEIVDLPNGTRIIPNDVAKKSVGGTTVNINLTVAGNVIGNKEYMEATGEYVSKKVIEALGVV